MTVFRRRACVAGIASSHASLGVFCIRCRRCALGGKPAQLTGRLPIANMKITYCSYGILLKATDPAYRPVHRVPNRSTPWMETPTTPDPGPACFKDAASSPGSCTATRRGTPSGRTSRRGTRGLQSRSPSLPLRRRPLRLNDPCSSSAKSNKRVDNADVSCSNAKCAYPADSGVYIVGRVAAYFSRVARVEANASLYGSQAVFVHFGKEPSTKHRRDPEKRRTGTQIRYSRQGAHIWVACTRHRPHLTMMHVDVQRARTPRAINEHQGKQRVTYIASEDIPIPMYCGAFCS